jgi:hypothetical protein
VSKEKSILSGHKAKQMEMGRLNKDRLVKDVGVSPSRWRSLEFIVYYIIFIVAYYHMIAATVDMGNGMHRCHGV